MVDYTIIIPHYDIPELLVRCIRSIPVRNDLQIIVVDDCSPDADSYLEKYPELSRPDLEIHSTLHNGGAGKARNVGLEHAKGRWLLFADADDFFSPEFDMLLGKYKHSDAELIYFRSQSVSSDNPSLKASRSEWLDDLWADYEKNGDLASLCGRCPIVWGKFFKRDIVDQYAIRFDETRFSNDFWFAACFACHAQKVIVSKELLYFPTVRPGSLAYGMNRKEGELEVRAEVCFRVQALLRKHGIKTLPYEPFVMYMNLLFHKGKRTLYYHYLHNLSQIGFPPFVALRQMTASDGLKRKLKVYSLSLIHLFI